MSRFDPQKVEWPGEPTHPSYSTAPGPDAAGNISMELGADYSVLPADTYRELYEAAEAMAEAIEGFFMGRPDGDDLLDTVRAYREGES
jgi:hypothetical protein